MPTCLSFFKKKISIGTINYSTLETGTGKGLNVYSVFLIQTVTLGNRTVHERKFSLDTPANKSQKNKI